MRDRTNPIDPNTYEEFEVICQEVLDILRPEQLTIITDGDVNDCITLALADENDIVKIMNIISVLGEVDAEINDSLRCYACDLLKDYLIANEYVFITPYY